MYVHICIAIFVCVCVYIRIYANIFIYIYIYWYIYALYTFINMPQQEALGAQTSTTTTLPTATDRNRLQQVCNRLQHTALNALRMAQWPQRVSKQTATDCNILPNPQLHQLYSIAFHRLPANANLKCVAACCSVLLCIAVCCSVLQCVAEDYWCRIRAHRITITS